MSTKIPCKKCQKITNVYHMEWDKIICTHCKAEIRNPNQQIETDINGFQQSI